MAANSKTLTWDDCTTPGTKETLEGCVLGSPRGVCQGQDPRSGRRESWGGKSRGPFKAFSRERMGSCICHLSAQRGQLQIALALCKGLWSFAPTARPHFREAGGGVKGEQCTEKPDHFPTLVPSQGQLQLSRGDKLHIRNKSKMAFILGFLLVFVFFN